MKQRTGSARFFTRHYFETKCDTIARNSRLGDMLVRRGLITALDLRQALDHQRAVQLPLGQILVRNQAISRAQLLLCLARQNTIRMFIALVLCAFSLTGGGGKKAMAGPQDRVPLQSVFTQASAPAPAGMSYAKLNRFPNLFGTEEKASANLDPFTKWTGVMRRLDDDMSSGRARAMVVTWSSRLGASGRSLKTLAAAVNDMMNAKPYIPDSRNWGQSDYWETPAEFQSRGGDCEDYAIAKYAALKSLGVPEERLRIAIVQDTWKKLPHAVLVVYTDEGPYILDNQSKSMLSGSGPGRYKPIFSINRTAWWLHTAPGGGTQIASVQ